MKETSIINDHAENNRFKKIDLKNCKLLQQQQQQQHNQSITHTSTAETTRVRDQKTNLNNKQAIYIYLL